MTRKDARPTSTPRIDARRRQFLQAAAAIGGAQLLPASALAAMVEGSGAETVFANGFEPINITPSGITGGYFSLPSLADERATYDLLGWARTAADEEFDFLDLGPIGTTDVHDDSEADDLWTWDAQARRGYTAPIVATMRGRWLTYFRTGQYRADLIADDPNRGDITPATSADPFCHGYGTGLITVGYLNNDATAMTEAEAIADIGLTALFGGTTAPGSGGRALAASGNNFGWGGGRQMARIGQLVVNLAYATGKAKWVKWLNALTDAYLTAANWAEAPALGIVQGGAYFCDRYWMDVNGQQGGAAWDAGARSNSIYQYGMHAEFLWRAFLVTRRADVRERLIKFARFMQHYAHDPAMTAAGGPFCGSYMGIAPGGGHWHRDNPGDAHYDCSVVNILVWGHKLTGDAALLTRARVHLRQGTRWREGDPGSGGGGPLVGPNEVADFMDTRRNVGGSILFTDNKGQLQYAYQVFENGGRPLTLDSGVPNYIRNLPAGNAYAIPNSRISNAFQTFVGEAGDPIAIFAFSGGAYDSKRRRLTYCGGGHNDHNGNGAYGFALYDSETPTWTLFKPHTSPPSIDNFDAPGPEDAPNGDPASSHTYNQIVYDEHLDKLVLCGLGSIAGASGSNVPRFRFLNLSANTWDPKSNAFLSTGVSMFGAAFCFHAVERAIYGRGGGSESKAFRFDSVANTLSTLSLSGTGAITPNIDSATAIHPLQNYQIFIGGYGDLGPADNGSADMILWDLSTRSGNAVTTYARTLIGFPTALRAGKLALEFHPPSGTFVAWDGGTVIHRLIPPANPFTGTWTFTTVTPGGSGLPTPADTSYGEPYSKFRWAPFPNDPSRGVFVVAVAQGTSGAYTASLTYVFKLNF